MTEPTATQDPTAVIPSHARNPTQPPSFRATRGIQNRNKQSMVNRGDFLHC
jgi:hypothetical protein